MSHPNDAPMPPGSPPRRRHKLRVTLIVVIVVAGLLVAADFGTRALAERVLAQQIQDQGFPKRPDVTIQGFPFLTQAVTRNLRTVDISSTDVTEGPLTISSVNAVLTGVHIDTSLHGGTVSQVNGSVFISFPAISKALSKRSGPLATALGSTGLKLERAGPHTVKATANLLITSFTATWEVSVPSGDQIAAKLESSTGIPASLLGPISSIKIPLPSLPLGLKVTEVSVTPKGLSGHVAGKDVAFGS